MAGGQPGRMVEETASGTTLRLLERVGGFVTEQNNGRRDITREQLNSELAMTIARIICEYYRNV